MKGSGAVTVASTVITAAASYSTATLSDAKPHAPSCQELASRQEQQRQRPPSASTKKDSLQCLTGCASSRRLSRHIDEEDDDDDDEGHGFIAVLLTVCKYLLLIMNDWHNHCDLLSV